MESRVAEEAHAGLLVGENEAAEIAGEGLNADAQRNEIVLIAEVLQLHFGEAFLQADVRIQPRGSFAHVEVDDAVFLHGQVVDIHLGRDLDSPVGGTERRVAMKQVEGKRQVLAHEELAEAPEELCSPGLAEPKPLGTGKRRPSANVSLVK